MNIDTAQLAQLPSAVRNAILIESGKTASLSVGGKRRIPANTFQQPAPKARPSSKLSSAVHGVSFAKDTYCSVDRVIFSAMEQAGARETSVVEATHVALSSSHNKSFLEAPFGSAPVRIRPDAVVMYITGEYMLKDLFLCARYVMSGSQYQPLIVSHVCPGTLRGTFVERHAAGPMGKGCRILANPISWYAPGRILMSVPPKPLLHEKNLVVLTACCLVRGDGSLFVSESGGVTLLDAQKMAENEPTFAPMSAVGLSTRLLVPALVDLLTRFFDKPFGVQALGARQARIFRVDAWMNSERQVHSIEVHARGFHDVGSARRPNAPSADPVHKSVMEMVLCMVNDSQSERFRVSTVRARPPTDAVYMSKVELVQAHVARLMTCGDEGDPHALSAAALYRPENTVSSKSTAAKTMFDNRKDNRKHRESAKRPSKSRRSSSTLTKAHAPPPCDSDSSEASTDGESDDDDESHDSADATSLDTGDDSEAISD